VSHYRWQLCVAGLLLGVTGLSLGCGTGEYENRLQQRLATLGQDAAASEFGRAVAIPDSTLTISMPKDFLPVDGGADPKRVKIPFADLPEWKATYEGAIEDSNKGKQHYYCYLAIAQGDNDPGAALHGRVNTAIPNTPAPADVQASGPGGKNETWRKFRATGKQAFWYVEGGGNGRMAEMDGVLEVWSRKVPEANCYVLFAWRAPVVNGKDIAGLDQKAPLMAGSVAVKK